MRRALAWLACVAAGGACYSDDTSTTAAVESCDTYCALSTMYCQNGNLLFVDPNDCPSVCGAYDPNGTAGAVNGNTLQCRLTYLFAAHKEPISFCEAASPNSITCQ